MRQLIAIIAKDLLLLVRDRAALVFITLAPVVVISVAGFSLATLYGARPTGPTGYDLPVVDEDDGELAREIEERLAADAGVRVRLVASRAEAERLVQNKEAGSALVIPAGTRAALAAGHSAQVLLFTDPVKYLERLNVRLRVLKVRDELAAEERDRVAEELAAQRERLRTELAGLEAALLDLESNVEALRHGAEEARERTAAELDAGANRLRADLTRQIREQLARLSARVNDAIAARTAELQAPARTYLDELAAARDEFERWFDDLKRLAERRAADIPPPPEFPEPPPELLRALEAGPAPIELPASLEIQVARPAAPELPAVVLPRVEVPSIELPDAAIPGLALDVQEVSVGGGSTAINTFDQNVPGFSVTFLLLGMLLGVSLGLLDERDWGTFDRLRAMPVAASSVLLGKLASRFTVGMAQMVLLFLVGYWLFDISLGPEPWALLLPIAGIVFAGATFGLIVAALAPSRDAVLPLGSVAIVTMAAVGGCWWPIDLEPRWMRTIALALPTTWAMEAFNDLMIRGRRADAAYLPFAVLVLHGLVFLGAGLWLFRRRVASES
jgi:ABC-type multidrug transport system permease subunit